MGKWYSWDFDCLILCAAFDCLITILPCVPPSPIYRQDVMTYIRNAALIAPFRGYMEDEDQVTYVYCASWQVFRVMQSFGVALQTRDYSRTTLQRACNVGQARASAVASVRRLGAFAQRGRAHCAFWATCREQFGLLFAQSVRRIVPQRMLDVRRGGCWHHG